MDDVRIEMLKGWRSSWESYVNTLNMMQKQGEKMIDLLFTQSENVHKETKSLIKGPWHAVIQGKANVDPFCSSNFNLCPGRGNRIMSEDHLLKLFKRDVDDNKLLGAQKTDGTNRLSTNVKIKAYRRKMKRSNKISNLVMAWSTALLPNIKWWRYILK